MNSSNLGHKLPSQNRAIGSDIPMYVSLFTSRLWRTSRTAYLIRKHSSLINVKKNSKENEIHKLIMLLLWRQLRKEAEGLAERYLQRLH